MKIVCRVKTWRHVWQHVWLTTTALYYARVTFPRGRGFPRFIACSFCSTISERKKTLLIVSCFKIQVLASRRCCDLICSHKKDTVLPSVAGNVRRCYTACLLPETSLDLFGPTSIFFVWRRSYLASLRLSNFVDRTRPFTKMCMVRRSYVLQQN